MIEWVIIAILVAVLWLFFKARHMKHRMYAVVVILLVLFIYVTGLSVLKSSESNLTTFKGFLSASKIYFNWLISLFKNVKTVAGNAIKMNWGNLTG